MVPEVVFLDQTDFAVASRLEMLQRASCGVEAELIEFRRIPPLLESSADITDLDLTILALMEGDEIIAMVGYRRRGDVVDIDRVAVHPSRLLRGHARSLLTEVHQHEADADRFEVSIGARNSPAIALYRSLGYRRLKDRVLEDGPVIARFVKPRCSSPVVRDDQ